MTKSSGGGSPSAPEAFQALTEALAHALHLLPAQAPLHAFVHHNTLHAFEELPFHQALEKAAEVFGAEAYPSERAFEGLIAAGAMTQDEVRSEVDLEFAEAPGPAQIGRLHFKDFAVQRLMAPLELPTTDALRFQLEEEELHGQLHARVPRARAAELHSCAKQRYGERATRPTEQLLSDLWAALSEQVPNTIGSETCGPRRRDQLMALTGTDADSLAIPHLIRLSAAYLDQGMSYWNMPAREAGFYECVRDLYRKPLGVLETWLASVAPELERQHEQEFSAEAACLWALHQLGVPRESFEPYVLSSLLALRGWAGMFAQFEHQPEKAPIEQLPARLVDFLAVCLILEVHAANHVLGQHQSELTELFGRKVSLRDLEHLVRRAPAPRRQNLEFVFEAYALAQITSVELDSLLDQELIGSWLLWVKALPLRTRQRLLLSALERRHLDGVVQGLQDHLRWLETRREPAPYFQAVFCIDDREESYRRHLEETEPAVRTFAYPGFFGVAMRFHAAGDVRPRDLCPVVLKATHVVREVDISGATPRIGHHDLHTSSKTLMRGVLLSFLGIVSVVPLVLGVLFPRWFHLKRKPAPARQTKMLFVRQSEPVVGELPEGYSHSEMADLVQHMLVDVGLTRDFCSLVLLIGHGANMVNNPLSAAYGCGATAGGCGGPNARVLADMANLPAVRALLGARGIQIADSVRFVGGMHDTTADDVSLYEPESWSEAAKQAFILAKSALRRASVQNAHERCRLFLQVPTTLTPERAKALVESQTVDLAAARPEFNHAKNSCAIVARRRWTRGLFMDKRTFLVSYEPDNDPDGSVLERVVMGAVPVGMGINLEYFFGTVDQRIYGSGSKLPHNVCGLVGIMDGHASDLRTGLNSQMVEPHEPVRLVAVVEAPPERLAELAQRRPQVGLWITNGWFQLLSWQPERGQLLLFRNGSFRPVPPLGAPLPSYPASLDIYQGKRQALPFVHVERGFEVAS